ncbi:hypothetical protein [Kitasatospora sp. NPDC088783]|uniref:hypothetical protein n=1 Tax=Kitasatospora sp. NPDC088783 TaxID=3364077 RepID=UPI00381F3387
MTHVTIEEHPVADAAAGPYSLTTGPDGALWFTLVHSGRIGRIVGALVRIAPGSATAGADLDGHYRPTPRLRHR